MLDEVLDNIKPTESEINKSKEVIERVKEYIIEGGDKLGIDVDPQVVGSVSRGTWISGDRDIDVFMLISRELNEDEFREKGLKLARYVGEKCDNFKEDFAEHPYVVAQLEDFDVDIVPCYRASDHTEVTSAVDRTPLHDKYVSKKINNRLRDNIRLLKKFIKGIRAYGSKLKVKGFSGYLTELLILHYNRLDRSGEKYGAFKKTIEEGKNWKKGDIIDLEEHGTNKDFEGPLIVLDPVDPNRNVAAALSLEKWSYFTSACQFYLRNPSKNFFYKKEIKKLDKKEIKNKLSERCSYLLGIEFQDPDLVEDTLYPQLYKSKKWIKSLLKEKGFRVLRTEAYDNKNALILIEVENNTLSDVRKHMGPPVTSNKHSKKFVKKYLSEKTFSGPYIEEDRWIVEKKRKFTNPLKLIRKKITNTEKPGIGKNLQNTNIKVLNQDKLIKKGYIKELNKFISKKAPWLNQ
ncbi:MAG: tRNA nucleotidyltransferase, CCA-adding enzyme [Candidatus Methanohalarchaeum thermophilum]|uniref:CCA-adding enzyme n=1 Tax=Methanohalarchaeum thermophilum TaxID=1903181 RepID=A0A1Q6DU15_METT1|nr:MAG: tRNA nucleotidyltransferase, CCA-adding enzyme [Candidatus Methanohalarchaeum thermophilum]